MTFFDTVKEIESKTARKLAAAFVERSMSTVKLINAYYNCKQLLDDAPRLFGRAKSYGLYEEDGNTPSPGVEYSAALVFRLYYDDSEIFPFMIHDGGKCRRAGLLLLVRGAHSRRCRQAARSRRASHRGALPRCRRGK